MYVSRMTRLWLNGGESTVDGDRPTRDPLDFHRKLPGYEPSSLVDVPELADELGLGRLWVKDESSRLALPSFKILGASWGVYRALDRHVGGFGKWDDLDDLKNQLAPHRPLALAAATDGNHGRARAWPDCSSWVGASSFPPEPRAPASRRSRARGRRARLSTGPTTTPLPGPPKRRTIVASSSR